MIEVYKILTGIYDQEVADDLLVLNTRSTNTRGHNLKLEKRASKTNLRKHSFTNRITEIWNNLPQEVVAAKTVKQFENRLDKFWINQEMKYDHNEDIKLIGKCAQRNRQENIEQEEVDIEAETPASIDDPKVS
ncbi:hypothetical protein SNE40_021413 [Patella caerulea]